jgi:hypothetical protein
MTYIRLASCSSNAERDTKMTARRLALVVFGIVITWIVCYRVLVLGRLQTIIGATPPYFPYVEFNDGRPRIVREGDLLHEPGGVIVPPGEVRDGSFRELSTSRTDAVTGRRLTYPARFHATAEREGVTHVEVSASRDDDRVITAYYDVEAATGRISNRRLLSYFGPGVVMKAGLYAVAINVVGWGIVALFFRRRRAPSPAVRDLSPPTQ